jgi:predicted nucleotidyltransferase
VVHHFGPERIILFGSHAWGRPDADSDIDLLVVFPGDEPLADRSLEIRRRVRCDFPLDLLTRSAGEVRRRIAINDSFMREIIERGKVLYERPHA